MQEFTVKDFARIFRKWWLLITMIPLIVVLLSSYYNYRVLVDIYTARTSLFLLVDYVDSGGNQRYDMASSREITLNLKDLFNRSTVMQQTAEEMNMYNLSSYVAIKLTTLPDTSLLEITATGSIPALCAEAANTASEVLVRYTNEIVKKECVQITQYASVPWTPTGPQRLQNVAISAIIALLVTVSGILILEIFNQRIKTDEQVESGLHLPVLGAIPNIRGKMKPYERGKGSTMQGIIQNIGSFERESFKTMATNISFVAVNPTVKTIAVASVLSDESMNAFIILTAYSFAETGKSVLLVDMDYRNQNLGPYLRSMAALDLVDYLAGRAKIQDIIMPTGILNVSFIGNNHSSTLFTRIVESDGFLGFLHEAERMYDVVLFNTPPLDLYIDAAVLASKVGGTVLVIPSNRIDLKHAKAAVEQIKRGGAPILGIVLNDIKPEKVKAYDRKPNKPVVLKKV